MGTCSVTGTGGWQTWADKTCTVSGATGIHDLYLKFTGGSGYLFNFNWWQFNGEQTKIVYGDLDGSGSVDSIDFSLMKQYMLGSITKFPSDDGLTAADVDASGAIDAIDFAVMKQYLLGMITKFPADV